MSRLSSKAFGSHRELLNCSVIFLSLELGYFDAFYYSIY